MKIDCCTIEMEQIDKLLVAIVFYYGDETVLTNVNNLSNKCKNILIINNGSEGKSQEIIDQLKKHDEVKIINNVENKGIGYALNQALTYANQIKKKYLLTMDQDSIITIECVSKLLHKISLSGSKIASVGPYYLEEKNEDRDVKYLITSGNMIRVDVANKIGGFDNELFIDCVDLDYSFKLLVNGYRMVRVGGTFMEHKIGDPQKDSPLGVPYLGHSPYRYFYNFRNNVYLYRKYFKTLPGRCLKLFLSLCLQFMQIILIEGNKREKIKQCWRGIRYGFSLNVPTIRRE